MRQLTITALTATLFLISSCVKVEPDTANTYTPNAQTGSRQANIADIQKYNDAVLLGTLDLLDDNLFVNSAISIALATFDVSEYTDYYAYFDELSAVFANANRDLLAEMVSSVSNHTADLSMVNILRTNGFAYSNGYYLFRPRLFLIHLDEMSYQSPSQAARLVFSNQDLGNIPVWSRNHLSNGFSMSTLNVSDLDANPVWVVSSSVVDVRNNEEVDLIEFEAGGKKKCKESNTTGWCVNSGKGCKCHYKDAINEASANFGLINAFINGTLDMQYYIGN